MNLMGMLLVRGFLNASEPEAKVDGPLQPGQPASQPATDCKMRSGSAIEQEQQTVSVAS
jgi:hypothetical protein